MEHKKTIAKFESFVSRVNGHLQVSLPWKRDVKSLPKNYEAESGRLASIERKFQDYAAEQT